jgi:hypothetical protein
MIRKSLLVLANSYKRNERCIAGRELAIVNGQTILSLWLRPVSAHNEGELSLTERVLAQTWVEVGVGDIVEVSLDHQPADPTQPENWLLWKNGDWTDISQSFARPNLDVLEERPPSLWLDPQAGSDRCRDGWLQQHPPAQSLYVVRAENLAVRLSCDVQGKVSRRARFEYGGQVYDLSLTDPEACRKVQPRVPRPGTGGVEIPVGSCRICISLARSFQGYHYKVVATILEGL